MAFLTREYKFETSTMLAGERKSFSPIRSIRKALKPLLRIIKKKQYLKKSVGEIQENEFNTSLEDMRNEQAAIDATDDNAANEALEQRILSEIKQCQPNAAIYVHQGGRRHVVPIHPEQKIIPVHFARTNNGTFFWTSVDTARHQAQHQHQQMDRWVQA